MMTAAECIICNSLTKRIFDLYDDRYGYPGQFELVECVSCRHLSLAAQLSSEKLSRLYTDYYPRSSESVNGFKAHTEVAGFRSWLNGAKRSAYSWVPPNVRVLDIGCGFGETLSYHKARGCEAYGVEVDENIRRAADAFGFNVHVGLFDPNLYEPGFFDYVTLDQVIEHVVDPITTLRGIASVLKPGGTAILSTPNAGGWGARVFGRRWINWHAPYHLHNFSAQSMRLAAERAGLTVEGLRTITSSDWVHHQWNHLLIFPLMGEPSKYWSPKAKRGLKDTLIWGGLSLVHRTKFNHVITRVFDFMGIGDNFLIFLRKP